MKLREGYVFTLVCDSVQWEGSLCRGVSVWKSLSMKVSVQGSLFRGSLCREGLCAGGLCAGGLCQGDIPIW